MEDIAVETQGEGLIRKVTQWQFPWFVFETSDFIIASRRMNVSSIHTCLYICKVFCGGKEVMKRVNT
jgi:arginine/ornithine N-succinyltransferase beta subunit